MAEEDIEAVVKRGQPFDAVPIRAPISGYVAKRSAVPGLSPQPGTELFQIADLSTVLIVADVNEQDVARVRVGERARISLTAYRGESFTGTVHFIYPALNPDSRTLQIRIQLDNPDLKLRPGMSGDVVIEVPPVDALTVPSESVVDTGELQYVFVEKARGRFEPRPVRIGANSQGRVQILEGLEEHDRVVTTANFFVEAESRLQANVEAFTAPPWHEDEKAGAAPQALRSIPGQR
jgi:Cu(I)/Ag(I) efflux system membrane fusion protein